MRIEIRLCKTLAQSRRGGGAFALSLPEGTTLDQALRRLGLGRRRLVAVLCNGESVLAKDGQLDGARALIDGDHLVLSAEETETTDTRGRLRRLGGLLTPRRLHSRRA